MMNNNKIAIICPYFGKLPKNIYYTLKSMSYNNFIDWFIFTDDKIEKENYNNIKIINFSFENVKKLIKNKIGTEIKNIYKLCDYKPLYGKIFEDYLKEYKYWGYCDLDMVFGNLSRFITSDRLEEFDKIYDLGHLSIYKNDELINNAYKNLKDYAKILNSEFIFVLDETFKNHISINEILEELNLKVYRQREDFSDIIIKNKNFYIVGKEKEKCTFFLWDKGKLTIKSFLNNNQQEIAYVHFQKRKFLNYEEDIDNENSFIIAPKGFFHTENLNKKLFFRGIDLRIKVYAKMRLKRLIDNYMKKRDKE